MSNALPAYGSVCNDHNFPLTGLTPATTFASAYSSFSQGSDFATDFAALLAAIAEIMNTDQPSLDGNDLLIASLTNWPDP